MAQLPDEPGREQSTVNVTGSRGVGIGGNVTGSQIFTGDMVFQFQQNNYTSADSNSQSKAQIYLSASLQACLVCIYKNNAEQEIIGVGFLVTQNHFVTTVNVIRQALGLDDQKQPGENGQISFDFPLLTSTQKFNARVVQWDPVNDLAGLEVMEALPEDAKPAILKPSSNIWGDSYQTFGFPEGMEMGAWAFGTIVGPQSRGQAQIKGDQERTGKGISLGFSGSPIWDTRLQGIVGMTRQVDTAPGSTAASMLTYDAMQLFWPLLKEAVKLKDPFRSLESFRIEHAIFFFGRDRMISRLIDKLQVVKFLALVGSSGSGKSSLVQAGLIPALQKENPNTIPILFRPGSFPARSLLSALVDFLDPNLPAPERLTKVDLKFQKITSTPASLLEEFALLRQREPEGYYVLLIDQFEEIFAPGVLKEDRQQFLDLLLLMNAQVQDIKILITLRADFFGQALSQPGLGRIIDEGQVNVLPMTETELAEAVTGPVRVVDGSFDPGLVEEIVLEVEGQPGNLPHLEFALAQLWEKRTADNRITRLAYESMGGVEGAIARHAQDEFLLLESQGKAEMVRRIFTRLVNPGPEGRDTRRRAGRRELEATQGDRTESPWQVVQVLANSRLLVTDRDALTGEETAEVAHETLIRNWKQLRDWVNAKRTFYVWRQAHLEPRIQNWKTSGDGFLDEQEVTAAKQYLAEQREELSPEEVEYIYHSLLRAKEPELEIWLPRFGTQEQVLQFLRPYLKAPDAQKRAMGVQALACLPKNEHEAMILQELQDFSLKDPSLEVAIAAAHGLCRRGQIKRLVEILNEDRLDPDRRRRLVKILADTRNLPQVGYQVMEDLRRFRRQVLIESASLLLQQYRNELALAFAITFLVGLLGGIGISVVTGLLRQAFNVTFGTSPTDPLNLFTFSIGSTDIMLVLLFGLFAAVQTRLIDQQPLEKKHLRPAIEAVFVYSFLFTLINWTGLLRAHTLSTIIDILIVNVPDLIATLIFANVLTVRVFLGPLFLDRRGIQKQSTSVAAQATIESMLWFMLLSLPLKAGILGSLGSGFDALGRGLFNNDFLLYFLGVSMEGFLGFLSNGLRIFIYLAGFYWGLQLAFQKTDVRERLSGGL